jgi:hypothetical protein
MFIALRVIFGNIFSACVIFHSISNFPQSISLPRRFALHILFCRGIFLYAPSPTPLLPHFIFLPRNNFCSILCLPCDILSTNSDSAGRLCFRGSFLPRDFFLPFSWVPYGNFLTVF